MFDRIVSRWNFDMTQRRNFRVDLRVITKAQRLQLGYLELTVRLREVGEVLV
jgi:hypothetical protein